MNPVEEGTARPRLSKTIAFFLPLALSSAMTMVTHSLISAGLARTINPAQSIAAYSVALNTEDVFETPITQSRQMTLALQKGPRSYNMVRRLALMALAVSFSLELLLAFTPMGNFVFSSLLGVPAQLVQETVRNFWIVMLLPAIAGIRTFFHGVIIKHRKTPTITTAMVGRVILIGTLIYGSARWGWLRGGYVGSVSLVAGVCVELVVAIRIGTRLLKEHWSQDSEPEEGRSLTLAGSWRFYYPLAAAAMLSSLTKPWISAGLARTANATTALAAYSVAWSLGSVIVNPMLNLHQATIVLRDQPGGDRHVRRFALGCGIVAASLLLLVGYSGVGRLILDNWIRVPETLRGATLVNLRMMAVLPLLFCWLEYVTGVLLVHQSTKVISAGKVGNLLITILSITALVHGSGFWGLAIGPLSQVFGAVAEGLILTWGWWPIQQEQQSVTPGTFVS